METIGLSRVVTGRLILGLIWCALSIAPAVADSTDGWWVSDGYGLLLEIRDEQIKGSEITAISCLPSFLAKWQGAASQGAEAVFTISPELACLVKPGKSADQLVVWPKGTASGIGFRRVSQAPTVCGQPAVDSPLNTFDVFWTTFDEHYPFFKMRGINWQQVRETYRPRITSNTTADELFGVFKAMIEPLYDAHTYIAGASEQQQFSGKRKNTERIEDQTQHRIVEIVETNYARGKLKTFCNGKLGYALLPGGIGYLRITAYGSYASSPGFDNELGALEDALDEVFAGPHKLQGLVVDVRVNFGGSDVLGVAVASRLATHDYLAFTKKARNDITDPNRFTDPQETRVRVSTRPHFHGPAVLLTGSNTVSAGETFAMALMGRKPAVKRVGENTQGVFSDVLSRKLPNGFAFGLPNEVFLTADGQVFEGPGIPPHVHVPVFSTEDLKNGRDPALEKAIEILTTK